MSCGELGKGVNLERPEDCAEFLRKHNAWRRGENDWTPDERGPDPKELGMVIDRAIELLGQQSDLLKAAEAAMQCIGDMGPSRPRVESFVMLQDAIASVKGSVMLDNDELMERDAERYRWLRANAIDCQDTNGLEFVMWIPCHTSPNHADIDKAIDDCMVES